LIEEAFEVATEFRFDVGQAMIGTNALRDSVDGLSRSADTAFSSLNYLAGGLVAHLGLGAGGLLGILSKSLSLTEDFTKGSMGFVNTISSNIGVLQGTIGSFNDQLETSKMLMGDINDVAGKLGLSGNEMARTVQLLAGPLAQRGKLGKNMSTGIQLAKNAMITGEATGLGTGMVTESLLRGLSPGGSIMGKLFERMVNTQTFRGANISRPAQLQNMNQDRKMDLIVKAMSDLGNNADYLRARLQSLRIQFEVFKSSIETILRPIGDALKVPLMKLLSGANQFLQSHSKDIGAALGKLLGDILEDPKKLFIDLMQLKSFSADFHSAFKVTEIVQMLMFLRWGLAQFGVVFGGGLIRSAVGWLWEAITAIGGFLVSSGLLVNIFNLLWGAAVAVGEVFLPLLFFFQILSRARAIAMVNDAQVMLELIPKFVEMWSRLKDAFFAIIAPISMAIDGMANLLAPLFEWGTAAKIALPALELFIEAMEWLGNIVTMFLADLSGAVNAFIYAISNLLNLESPLKGFWDHFSEGIDTFLDKHPLNTGTGGITPASKYQITNNNHIEARFDMREQLEPDRIAFAVTDHLKKLAINATQSRGSLQSAHAGAIAGSN
jgi:hypothetical protein